MHVGGLLVLRPPSRIDPQRIAAVIERRARRIPRLRKRLRLSLHRATWADDPRFDAARHIHGHVLPRGAVAEMTDYAGKLMTVQLDRAHPLWAVHVITSRTSDDVVVLMKLHHAVADGIGATLLGFGLLDQGEPQVIPQEREPSFAQRMSDLAGSAVHEIRQARQTAAMVADVLGGIRVPSSTPLPAGQARSRRLMTTSLPLADVKAARARHGGTVNDVLLAVFTGALREWMVKRGPVTDGAVVRALIPVSRRPRRGDPCAPGNQLSAYLCDLPVALENPKRQLRYVRAQMDGNKARGPLRGPGVLPVLANRIPALVHRIVTPLAGRGAPLMFDTVISNVPVPPLELTIDGIPVEAIHPVIPLAPGNSMTIGVMTHRSRVHVGLFADRHAVADLDVLSAAIPQALSRLTAAEPAITSRAGVLR